MSGCFIVVEPSSLRCMPGAAAVVHGTAFPRANNGKSEARHQTDIIRSALQATLGDDHIQEKTLYICCCAFVALHTFHLGICSWVFGTLASLDSVAHMYALHSLDI